MPVNASALFRSCTTLLALLTLLSIPPHLAGASAEETGQYVDESADDAFETWLLLAVDGDAEAQFILGLLHSEGRNVPVDLKQAAYWYQKAAGQGHTGAQYNLAHLLLNGQGVPKDPAQALYWWHRAARSGHILAQHNLGYAYYKGIGVRQDHDEARRWFMEAANAGDPRASAMLVTLERETEPTAALSPERDGPPHRHAETSESVFDSSADVSPDLSTRHTADAASADAAESLPVTSDDVSLPRAVDPIVIPAPEHRPETEKTTGVELSESLVSTRSPPDPDEVGAPNTAVDRSAGRGTAAASKQPRLGNIGTTPDAQTRVEATTPVSPTPRTDDPFAAENGNPWLYGQPADFYTLQIISARRRSIVETYAAQTHLRSARLFHTRTENGEDWWYLIYGSYPNEDAAQAAVASLNVEPESVWIRRFGVLQQKRCKALADTQHEVRKFCSGPADSAADGQPAVDASAGSPSTRASASEPYWPRPPEQASILLDLVRHDDNDWLFAQPRNYYTVQLLSVADRSRVARFLREYKLETKALTFTTRRAERDWFFAIYGSHPSLDAAIKTSQTLPVPSASVWIRQFASIQQTQCRIAEQLPEPIPAVLKPYCGP